MELKPRPADRRAETGKPHPPDAEPVSKGSLKAVA
jgi:hypothetical protein